MAQFSASIAPNPFTGHGALRFVMPRAGTARIEVFDAQGRSVRDEANTFEAGIHAIEIGDLAARPGIYFYRAHAFDQTRRGRFTVLR